MPLIDQTLSTVVAFRRKLHTMPEVSGDEHDTAREVAAFLTATKPDELIMGLGGHCVAAVYDSGKPGPTVMLRAELDGLPILETGNPPHKSLREGRAHLCGHDGHMATLAAVALELAHRRPVRGRIVLMFQPAEETGAGARAVVGDPKFQAIKPDISFAYHNMPGVPLGHVWLDAGVVNCASRGLKISLEGKTAHASEPENGTSPLGAVASLMPTLAAIRTGHAGRADFAMVTVTHARLGEPAFGIAPGMAEIFATLRTLTDAGMASLVTMVEAMAREAATAHRLQVRLSYADIFAHVENAPAAVQHLRAALDAEGLSHQRGDMPFKASEDFGVFGHDAPAAMFYLGAGETHPRLHNPNYDFPDALLPIAARVLTRAARQLVG